MAENEEDLSVDPDIEELDQENIDNKDTKTRAAYWKYYTLITVSGVKYAKCNLCIDEDVKYKYSGKCNSSSGNMKRHLKSRHPVEFLETENAKQGEFVSRKYSRK